MIDFKTGDIFLVNFDPSIGHEYKKIRPAIVIQSEKTIKNSALITIMPITSQLSNCRKEDINIKKSAINGLYSDSLVKVGCVHSFDRKRFLKRIGNIPEETMAKIIEYLRIHFNIPA
ncbi:MAG: type II toxin-antitoxin system PemK/MazF family toxin [Candidatus Gracilibacteria bacterium]